MSDRVWKACGKCKKMIKRFHRYKGNIICHHCFVKRVHIIGFGNSYHTKTLEQVLDKVYTPYQYVSKNGSVILTMNFPKILAGKKFKIVLVDEDEK